MKTPWRLLGTYLRLSSYANPGAQASCAKTLVSKIWSEDDQQYYCVSIKDAKLKYLVEKIARDRNETPESLIRNLAKTLEGYVGESAVQRREFFRSVFIGDDWGAPPRLNSAPWTLEFAGFNHTYAKNLATFMMAQGDPKKIVRLLFFYEKLNNEIRYTDSVVNTCCFTDRRNLHDYAEKGPCGIVALIKNLGPRDLWVDTGNGFAQQTYYEDTDLFGPRSNRADMLAITVAVTSGFVARKDLGVDLVESGKFNLLSGKPIEEIEFGQNDPLATVFSDIFGAGQYATFVGVAFESMGSRVRPGGTLLIHMRPGVLVIKDRLGNDIDIAEWMNQIKGLKYDPNFKGGRAGTYCFRRTVGEVCAPRLQLVELNGDRKQPALTRIYIWYDYPGTPGNETSRGLYRFRFSGTISNKRRSKSASSSAV
jgi:SAM-dependent methyltransferase